MESTLNKLAIEQKDSGAEFEPQDKTNIVRKKNPTKRKKLVPPDFYDWPEVIDFNASTKYLESIGKMATPVGTPEGFKNTLSAARLIKHLVDMWQLDEQERNNRKYVEGEEAKITILPESWLIQSLEVQLT